MEDDKKSDGLARRTFCVRSGQATLVAALGGALSSILQACGGTPTSSGAAGDLVQSLPFVAATPSGATLTVAIDSASPLATVGAAALVESANAAVLVVRTGASAFTALSAICTHQACTITGYTGSAFVCPCHGSLFSTSGQVLSGPAFVALRRYNTQFANNVLTITA